MAGLLLFTKAPARSQRASSVIAALPVIATTFAMHAMVGRRSRQLKMPRPDAYEFRVPSALEQIQRILAIPMKKTDSRLVRHLGRDEIQALLDAPQPIDWLGVRDRAMLHLCFAAGLRVSELTGLRLDDLSVTPHASILVHGKGRKERCLPLWKVTTVALRAWLAVRGPVQVPELFVNARREPMTRSGFEYILEKYVRIAGERCPSLNEKCVSPHVLRHSCALAILDGDQRSSEGVAVARTCQHAND